MRFLALCLAALALAPAALASERHPSLHELEGEVMCPTCHTTVDQSNSAIANRIRDFMRTRIEAGASKSQIKAALVSQFGPAILAEPRKHGFDLLAWLLPLGGLALGAVAVALAAWHWSRRREPRAGPEPALEPELELRVDAALRSFDS
ncbi:MAG: cytochrome c-type biogenesis protein [Gaiellaceae bacterium]